MVYKHLLWPSFGKLRFAIRKNLAPPILDPFGPNLDLFGSNISLKTCLWLGTWSEYSSCIHFRKFLSNSFVMMLFFSFQMWDKCESLCKQSQKRWRSAQMNSGWRLISKIDMGKSMVLFFSIPMLEMWEPYVNKARNSEWNPIFITG